MAWEKWFNAGMKIASVLIIPILVWGISVETRYWQVAGDRAVIKTNAKHNRSTLEARIKVVEDKLSSRESMGKQLSDQRVLIEQLKGKINGNELLLKQIQTLLSTLSGNRGRGQ